MRIHLPAFCLMTVLPLSVFSQTPTSGIDLNGIDKTCKPCDDFFQFANGTWIEKNPIPERYSRWGTFQVMNEANRERLRTILDAAVADTSAPKGSAVQKIGDYYSSCLDTGAIDKLGWDPLKPGFAKIDKISSSKAISSTILDLQKDGFRLTPMFYGDTDLKNSSLVILNVTSGGLSLPDRDYYFKTDDRSKTIREELVKHIAKMFELTGVPAEQAATSAKNILAFETKIADATMTNVDRRDPYKSYNINTVVSLTEMAPNYDWKAFIQSAKVPETSINVGDPKALKAWNDLVANASLDDWKAYLKWKLLDQSANLLSKPFVDQNFAFRGTVISGTKEQLPRWQTCTNAVDGNIGEALGQTYVDKYFPPKAKQRMMELVENLRATLRESLESADWLEASTRKAAVAKLQGFVTKIGYPEKWETYSTVNISRDSYFNNSKEAQMGELRENLSHVGKAPDKKKWEMTPPTINAYYNPPYNEIVFPAGILQPPFFDMNADDAANYGAIGAVIGHEMGHGFDDQGSKFDVDGNLKNWWTPEDRRKFEDRAGCIVDQFFNLDVGEGLRHNGKLVTGEAMGDLGGLTIAYRAYKRSLKGKEAPVLDGYTGDQRFFLAFARVWAGNQRPEAKRLLLNTDPHPLGKFRANGTLQNMPEFQKAFSCKEGDPMVRPAKDQCKLW